MSPPFDLGYRNSFYYIEEPDRKGMMESWVMKLKIFPQYSNIPSFHSSVLAIKRLKSTF
jgi:hypothetical protein